ncbi:MAG: GGDEF domain-containing response regulator [Longimicrobiales bacterium]
MEPLSFSRRPLVVVAGQHNWLVRSLESIFASSGFTVVTAGNEDLTTCRLPDVRPDLILLEADPPDVLWGEVFTNILKQPGVTTSTPIIAATAEPLTREKRLDALRAGAWDVFGHPLDAEVLTLKAAAYVRAKMEADEARDRGLVDPETDLYNVRGVLRRIYEAASEAMRHKRPLACLVAALDVPPGSGSSPEETEFAKAAALALRRTGRASDVLGRLGPNEFVVIAPGTDAAGARRLAQRLTGSNGNGHKEPNEPRLMPRLRAGYAAVGDLAAAEIEPVDLFVRAVVALRTAQAVGAEERIRSFD